MPLLNIKLPITNHVTVTRYKNVYVTMFQQFFCAKNTNMLTTDGNTLAPN